MRRGECQDSAERGQIKCHGCRVCALQQMLMGAAIRGIASWDCYEMLVRQEQGRDGGMLLSQCFLSTPPSICTHAKAVVISMLSFVTLYQASLGVINLHAVPPPPLLAPCVGERAASEGG